MPELEDGTHTKDISDGYHTFGELYEWRHMLFLLALKLNAMTDGTPFEDAWYTKKHHPDNDPMFEIEGQPGLLVGLDLVFIRDKISLQFHMPMRMEKAINLWANEIEYGPYYDGRNSPDKALKFLEEYVGLR